MEQDEIHIEKVPVAIETQVVVPKPGESINTENIYNKRLTGDVGSTAIHSRSHNLMLTLNQALQQKI
jgi:hypothetical protein